MGGECRCRYQWNDEGMGVQVDYLVNQLYPMSWIWEWLAAGGRCLLAGWSISNNRDAQNTLQCLDVSANIFVSLNFPFNDGADIIIFRIPVCCKNVERRKRPWVRSVQKRVGT